MTTTTYSLDELRDLRDGLDRALDPIDRAGGIERNADIRPKGCTIHLKWKAVLPVVMPTQALHGTANAVAEFGDPIFVFQLLDQLVSLMESAEETT